RDDPERALPLGLRSVQPGGGQEAAPGSENRGAPGPGPGKADGRSLGGAFASGKLHSSGRLTLRSVSSRRGDRLPARRAARSRAVRARTDRSARRGLLEPPFRRPLRDGPLREQEERRGRLALEQPGMTRPKAWLSWSSGKDSAWALETVRRDY